jgi:signal transduction histidine kinase
MQWTSLNAFAPSDMQLTLILTRAPATHFYVRDSQTSDADNETLPAGLEIIMNWVVVVAVIVVTGPCIVLCLCFCVQIYFKGKRKQHDEGNESWQRILADQADRARVTARLQDERERLELPQVADSIWFAGQQQRPMAASMPAAAGSPSAADTIRELRKLCDDGVITEAEFESKKKILLDVF